MWGMNNYLIIAEFPGGRTASVEVEAETPWEAGFAAAAMTDEADVGYLATATSFTIEKVEPVAMAITDLLGTLFGASDDEEDSPFTAVGMLVINLDEVDGS